MHFPLRAVVLLAWAAAPAGAQSIPGAVLAKNEPHHHLAYEDAVLRVLRVRVPPHDTTLLHEHDPDYFWIALGASEVVNARLGAPPATVKSADLSIHYTTGRFAHVARNPGAVPFDNITVELLGEAGAAVRNRCEEAMPGVPLDCPAAVTSPQPGVTVRAAFATAHLQVDLVTIAGHASLGGGSASPAASAPWIIALRAADTVALRTAMPANPGWRGGVWRAPAAGDWAVANTGATPLRALRVTQVRR